MRGAMRVRVRVTGVRSMTIRLKSGRPAVEPFARGVLSLSRFGAHAQKPKTTVFRPRLGNWQLRDAKHPGARGAVQLR